MCIALHFPKSIEIIIELLVQLDRVIIIMSYADTFVDG